MTLGTAVYIKIYRLPPQVSDFPLRNEVAVREESQCNWESNNIADVQAQVHTYQVHIDDRMYTPVILGILFRADSSAWTFSLRVRVPAQYLLAVLAVQRVELFSESSRLVQIVSSVCTVHRTYLLPLSRFHGRWGVEESCAGSVWSMFVFVLTLIVIIVCAVCPLYLAGTWHMSLVSYLTARALFVVGAMHVAVAITAPMDTTSSFSPYLPSLPPLVLA